MKSLPSKDQSLKSIARIHETAQSVAWLPQIYNATAKNPEATSVIMTMDKIMKWKLNTKLTYRHKSSTQHQNLKIHNSARLIRKRNHDQNQKFNFKEQIAMKIKFWRYEPAWVPWTQFKLVSAMNTHLDTNWNQCDELPAWTIAANWGRRHHESKSTGRLELIEDLHMLGPSTMQKVEGMNLVH